MGFLGAAAAFLPEYVSTFCSLARSCAGIPASRSFLLRPARSASGSISSSERMSELGSSAPG